MTVREDLAAALLRAGDAEERASRLLLELRAEREVITKLTAQLQEQQILAAPLIEPPRGAHSTAEALLHAAWAQQRAARSRRAICINDNRCILTGGHAGRCSAKWQTYIDPAAGT